jgi:peptide/nickel transport system substrate-binding protein
MGEHNMGRIARTSKAFGRRSALGLIGASVVGLPSGLRAQTTPQPRRGGTLTTGFQDDAKTLDPSFSIQLSERQVLYTIFNTLLRMGTDFSLHPGLAASWAAENDGNRMVFRLQEGVKFHDGTDFDAAAVKWNIDRRLDDKMGSPQRNQLRPVIAGVDVVDTHTVAFNMKRPFPPILSEFADRSGFMMSPTAAAKYGPDVGRHPVGTGPFIFKEWVQGSRITVERNDSYWQTGHPYLDKVVFADIPSPLAGVQRLLTGEIDYVDALSPQDLHQIATNPRVATYPVKVGRWYSLQWQVDKPPFDNAKLRQAIAYALDRNRINDITMEGRATIANSPVPPGLWWSPPDSIVYNHDPAKAKQLLQEAGVTPGTQLVLSAPSDPLIRKIDQLVQEQLAEVGLKVRLEPVALSEWYARVVQRAINFTPQRWTQRADPDGLLYILFDSKGFANSTGYSNPEVDKLLEEARQTFDTTRRKVLYAEAIRYIQEDLPYVSLYFAAEYAAINKDVHGFEWTPDEIPRFRGLWKSGNAT